MLSKKKVQMATKLNRPCARKQCPYTATSNSRYCALHKKAERKKQFARLNANRLNANQRGYNYRWQKQSKSFLKRHPFCTACWAQGKSVLATLVDHIVPHKRDMRLFWDRSNWQGLCKKCHSKKTAKGE